MRGDSFFNRQSKFIQFDRIIESKQKMSIVGKFIIQTQTFKINSELSLRKRSKNFFHKTTSK